MNLTQILAMALTAARDPEHQVETQQDREDAEIIVDVLDRLELIDYGRLQEVDPTAAIPEKEAWLKSFQNFVVRAGGGADEAAKAMREVARVIQAAEREFAARWLDDFSRTISVSKDSIGLTYAQTGAITTVLNSYSQRIKRAESHFDLPLWVREPTLDLDDSS